MPNYVISKSEGNYIIYRERIRLNPEINYSSLLQVLSSVITSDDDISSITLRLGQEVASEKDAQAFRLLFRHLQSILSAEARLSKLEDEMLSSEPEMTIKAFVDHLRQAGLLK